ncbi:hypothetical protein [Fibrobacter intestinalis]|uniref:hypothetical protein n=1 Tax=Fibrobacter sp. NR9 TaxID=1896200 RepID=UPI000BB113E0|nr:hypothetical protein [Fibrobacter sp. NR9]PBC75346.1 hypothetical protein BGW94_3034 [Fibrobacter sp. NR9]
MAQIIDQIVNISINDAISVVTTTDVNTMALVGKSGSGKDSAEAGEFASSDDIGDAYGTDSELYAMGVKFFAQDSQPSKVVCIPAPDLLAHSKRSRPHPRNSHSITFAPMRIPDIGQSQGVPGRTCRCKKSAASADSRN